MTSSRLSVANIQGSRGGDDRGVDIGGGVLEENSWSWLCLDGHGDGNEHSNQWYYDNQGTVARSMDTRAATRPSTVVTKIGTATLEGWVQVIINATSIRFGRTLTQ